MAIKGKMYIDGYSKNFSLVECEYNFNQTVDSDGLPNDGISGGQVIATIVTPSKGVFLYEWMLHNWMFHNGYIEFVTNVNSSHPSYHIIMFEDAKCVDLFEYFNNQNHVMMTTRLTLQCGKIGFYNENDGGIAYDFRRKKVVELSAGQWLTSADRDPGAPFIPYLEKSGIL